MYCPRCSQQQVTEEVRFCSRCGLPLGAVRELVAAGGGLAERAAEVPAADPSKALKGVRKGVKLMLAAFPLALFAGVLTANEEEFAFLFLLPVLCLVAGFARLLYGTFVEGRAPRVRQLDKAARARAFAAAVRARRGPRRAAFADGRDASAAQRDGEHDQTARRRARPARQVSALTG